MKIKKVYDKPMVIHTKKKAKLHTHEPKNSSIRVAGAAGVQTVLSQMEGGEEIRAAAKEGAKVAAKVGTTVAGTAAGQ